MHEPRIHSTPPAAVRARLTEPVIVNGTTFRITRPDDPDMLFDHPAVRAAYAADEYIPYWSNLWPAARMLAKAVLREPWETFPLPREALEIGCGVGLGGVAALSRGIRVTFSDCDELAVGYAVENARQNGFTNFTTAMIDLRSPPPGLQVPILLGSDLMYEPRFVEPLIAFISAVLAPGGLCLIADPDRLSAKPFRWLVENAGLGVVAEFARAGEPGGERTKGTVYRITR
ncbi:MAG: class I SAM-dependent methyltransferase [Fimbriiglobus sp.]